MYNIQFCSDLHLDQLGEYDCKKLIRVKSNVLVLAGDICHISSIDTHSTFFSYISQEFEYIIYVPGNHEFYNKEGMAIKELEEGMRNFLCSYPNIIYLNNQSVFIDNILFTGSCLWCNPEVDPPSWFKINMNREDIQNLYYQSLNYIVKVSSLNYKNHVIITHYPPILIKNDTQSSKISKYISYYENNDILLKNRPLYWIFGHIHKNLTCKKNNTVYLSNQLKGKNYRSDMSLIINI